MERHDWTEQREVREAAVGSLRAAGGGTLLDGVPWQRLLPGDLIVARVGPTGEVVQVEQPDYVVLKRRVTDVEGWRMHQIMRSGFAGWGPPRHDHERYVVIRPDGEA